MAQSEIESENEVQKSVWSAEQERMPLKQRLKLLLASQRLHSRFDDKSQIKTPVEPIKSNGTVVVKKENDQCDPQNFNSDSVQGEMIEKVIRGQKHSGGLRECINRETVADNSANTNQTTLVVLKTENVDSIDTTSVQQLPLQGSPSLLKVECHDECVISSLKKCTKGSIGFGLEAVRTQVPDDVLDDLDHIVLKERLRRLLTSKSLEMSATTAEDISSGVASSFSAARHKQRLGTGKSEQRFCHENIEKFSSSGHQYHGIDKTLKSGSFDVSTMEAPFETLRSPIVEHHSQENIVTSLGNVPNIHRNSSIYTEKSFSEHESNDGHVLLSADSGNVPSSAVLNLAHVKVEPLSHNEFESVVGHMSLNVTVPVKSELELHDEHDKLDHMILKHRMKLFSSRKVPQLSSYGSPGWQSNMFPSDLDCRSVALEPAKPLKINRPRKRRKTATDSVETAMQEDAPGLLQALIEKGVSVGEIKLYDELESDDALDDSSTEGNFAELEEIIYKLFSQRHSLLKLAPLGHSKREKATYCLACLFSLVEQARYLQFRRWPVEWGWCRDLQSFIFVFERHNRLVLERPEYGYATYFFDLVDSSPINWQIRRLVTAMKLTSCGRLTLIENKALMVGEDLTEGEAKVLMEYGWVPNTGLGTMLNYFDRVVHDRNNEKDSSEWRSKIGKLLVDGYNGGTKVSALPNKLMEPGVDHPCEIKLELD